MFNRLKSNSFSRNCFIIFSFLMISLFSICVLYHTHTLFGAGDMQFHIKRIMELKESFSHRYFLPHFAFNYFHGSAVMSLYPYLTLYPIVILSQFIKSYITLIYLYVCINTFVSLIICYYSSYVYSKSHVISYVFSVIYSLSSPFMTYYFGNMDLGVSTTLAILPLVIFGFIEIFKINNRLWLMLPIGMSLIIYTHVLSIFIVAGSLIIWAFINFRLLNKKIFKRIFYSIILTILLTSIVWVPAINLIVHNINNIRPLNTPQLLGYNLLSLFKVSILNRPNFCLGIFSLVGIFLSILYYKYFGRINKQMLWISIFFIFICSNFFPWKRITSLGALKLLNVFQFTYRFYIIPQIFLSYLSAVCLVKLFKIKYIKKYKWIFTLMLVLIPMSLQLIFQISIINNCSSYKTFNNQYINRNSIMVKEHHKVIKHGGFVSIPVKENVINYRTKYYYNYNSPMFKLVKSSQVSRFCREDIKYLASLDYYPMNSVLRLNDINNYYVSNMNDTKKLKLKKYGFNKFKVNNQKNMNKVHVPILLYKGEDVVLYLNNHIHHFYVNKYGMMTTHINKGENKFYIHYNYNHYVCYLELLSLLIGLVIVIRLI